MRVRCRCLLTPRLTLVQSLTNDLDTLLKPLPQAVRCRLVNFAQHLRTLRFASDPDYEALSFHLSDAADAAVRAPPPSATPESCWCCAGMGDASGACRVPRLCRAVPGRGVTWATPSLVLGAGEGNG